MMKMPSWRYNGIFYTAKWGYQYWHRLKCSHIQVPQSVGWKKVWHLKLPHKVKVFIWQFCRNVIPVRKRLSSRGVRIPITCPMCHLFFDCEFAARCWEHANLRFDWSQVENANEWLLRKISTTRFVLSCGVLRAGGTRRFGMTRLFSPLFAMDNNFQMCSEWIDARENTGGYSPFSE